MHTKKILIAALMSTLLAPAFAGDFEFGDGPDNRTIVIANSFQGADGVRITGPLLRADRTVKGMPFSAEVISERQQNLADGNDITVKTSSMSYRDSAGRTRQEIRDSKGELRTITIRETDGTMYVLNPQQKTANKIVAPRELAEVARSRIEALRKEGKVPGVERSKGPNGEEIVIKRVEKFDGELRKNIQENVRVHVARAADAGAARELARGLALGGAFGAFGDAKYAAKAVTRELGTKEIEGVKADGSVRSYEIPAGEIGNRNAIVVTDETWYSPELQVTLLTKHSDPRSGDHVYRLDNIKRGEPDAALFAVPSDYTVKDVMNKVENTLEKKAP
ncbi:hypothetical protein [Pseudoduganella rhizocola]|uniref:hypothetical protein n=1 Tax=Pseudoduganella rhizocola TaxID=3382643 RepID=UPI0038B474F6